MSKEEPIIEGRWSRLARLAGAGLKAGLSGSSSPDAAQDVAKVLGRLRGLAAKLGQMAGYVDGIIPEERRESFETALAPLMSDAVRSSPAEVRRVVEAELDAPVEELFAEWSEQPFASASVGQVHRARLKDGRSVAVKVQHPGVAAALEGDLANAALLEGVAGLFGGRRFDSKALLATLRTRFLEELDYGLEARRQQQFGALHRGDPRIIVPEVVVTHSSRRVVTSTFVEGRSFAQLCEADEQQRRQAAETLWRFVYKSINVGGIFNADPHPGNYLFQDDGRVAFLDFGCVQTLTQQHRDDARLLHRAAMTGAVDSFAPIGARMVRSRPGRLEDMAVDYLRQTFRPVLESPFRITREFAAGLFAEMRRMATEATRTPDDEFFTMPPESLFMNRLHFGFYSVLARLDVAADYRAVEQGWWRDLYGE